MGRIALLLALGGADNEGMAAVAVEAISPELALVCPELRERALAALPDPIWASFVVQARARAVAPPRKPSAWSTLAGVALYLADELKPPVVLMLCGILLTVVLTFVADAIR